MVNQLEAAKAGCGASSPSCRAFSPYPLASRVGPVAGEADGAHDPRGAFEFGLARLLDGLEVFIARGRAG